MEEEYEIKHTAFGDIKVRKSKPASHDDDEPITIDPCLTNQEPAAVEEEEEEHVMTPEEIEDNIRQAYEHYDAGDYAEAASLLEAIVFQECSDTPADVLSLLALMYWEGNGYEQSASDAFYFAARAHLGDNKLGTYVLACIFSERNNYKDMHIALQLCRQLNEYRKSQPLLMKLESMELPEDKKPHDDLSTNGHDGIWDLVLYAYSCAQTGDAEWALWCARRMRRKPFSRFADEDKLLSLFEIAAKELVDGKLECARIYAGRHEWGEAVERYDSAFEQCHNRESAAALTKAFDIGRGYQASEKNKRYYAYQWAKLDYKQQEFIFSHYYPEEHNIYLRGVEAYDSGRMEECLKLYQQAAEGHHLLADLQYTRALAEYTLDEYYDSANDTDDFDGEAFVRCDNFDTLSKQIKWFYDHQSTTDWTIGMLGGFSEILLNIFDGTHSWKRAADYFGWAGMTICKEISTMAAIMQEGLHANPAEQKQRLADSMKRLRRHAASCKLVASERLATTAYGLALHRRGKYLPQHEEELRRDASNYRDFLYRYEQELSEGRLACEQLILPCVALADEQLENMPFIDGDSTFPQVAKALQSGKTITRNTLGDVLIIEDVKGTFYDYIIYAADLENGITDLELADCKMAAWLLGVVAFYTFMTGECHRLNGDSKRAERYLWVSHYLMGFSRERSYHYFR